MPNGQLHGKRAVRTQRGDVMLGIEDLNLRIRLDVAGGDFALAGGFDIDGLGSVAVKTGDDALHVENDLGHILGHAGDGGKLMLDAGDLDLRDRRSGQGGEENTPQGVAQGRAIAALQRFDNEFAVGCFRRIFDALDTRLFYFDHVVPSLRCRRRGIGAADVSAYQSDGGITWSTARR